MESKTHEHLNKKRINRFILLAYAVFMFLNTAFPESVSGAIVDLYDGDGSIHSIETSDKASIESQSNEYENDSEKEKADNYSGDTPVCTAVSAGSDHSLILLSDGTVKALGWNSFGQCDTGNWSDIIAVAAGYAHSVGLRKDGKVVATGANDDGECDVDEWTDIVQVCAGAHFTAGLDKDGYIHIAGTDEYYLHRLEKLLGTRRYSPPLFNRTDDEYEDIPIMEGDNELQDSDRRIAGQIKSVSASGSTILLLMEDGTVYIEGNNIRGLPYKLSKWSDLEAVTCSSTHILGLRRDHTVIAEPITEEKSFHHLKVDGLEHVAQISAGRYDSFFLMEDGTVLAAGQNNYGQCSVSNWKNMSMVSAGETYTLGLRNDGAVIAVGYNYFGQHDIPEEYTREDFEGLFYPDWCYDENNAFYGQYRGDNYSNPKPSGFVVYLDSDQNCTTIGTNYGRGDTDFGNWTGTSISLCRKQSDFNSSRSDGKVGQKNTDEISSIRIVVREEEDPVEMYEYFTDGQMIYLDMLQDAENRYRYKDGIIYRSIWNGTEYSAEESIPRSDFTMQQLEKMGMQYKSFNISINESHNDLLDDLMNYAAGSYIISAVDSADREKKILSLQITNEGNVSIDYGGKKWGYDSSDSTVW